MNQSRNTKWFIGLIIFEFLICSILIFYLFGVWQKYRLKQTLALSTKIDISKQNFPEESELKHFYMPSPNWVEYRSENWLDHEVYYKYNNDALNDTLEYSVQKEPNTLRIIALGDSFTFGQNVSTPDNWTEVAERQLNQTQNLSCNIGKVEILNLGVYGYDVEYSTEYYRLVGQKYNPDLIIWYESGTGFTRLNEWTFEESAPCEEQYKTEEGSIPIERKLECLTKADEKVHSLHSEEEVREYIGKSYHKFFNENREKPVLIFSNITTAERDSEVMKKNISEFENVKYIPNIPEIYNSDRLPDAHLNENGHKKIGKYIADYLLEILPEHCSKFGL